MLSNITKYGKRIQLVMFYALTAAIFVCMFVLPFVSKRLLKVEAGYYIITINGQEAGVANSRQDAKEALALARKKLSSEYNVPVAMDLHTQIKKSGVLLSSRENVDELSNTLYSTLLTNMTDVNSRLAYAIETEHTRVVVATKQEAQSVLSRLLTQYDSNHAFAVQLKETESPDVFSAEIEKSSANSTDKNIISAALNGANTQSAEEGLSLDTVMSISFAEKITVNVVLKEKEVIRTEDDAYNVISQATKVNQIHYVAAGDTMQSIAQQYNMTLEELEEENTRFTQNSVLVPGDEVTITVHVYPVSMAIIRRETQDGDYFETPEYVDDATKRRGNNTIEKEAQAGQRKRTVETTYINGLKTSENVIEENITKHAVAAVISVGTLADSDYIRPIAGTVVSNYGKKYFNGRINMGTDWKAGAGTYVNAAAAGTVTRAGWYLDYGYCIDITHENGAVTRYAHLQEIGVYVGQKVAQGERIALSGNTGETDTSGLHFELWLNGRTVNPLDYVNK